MKRITDPLPSFLSTRATRRPVRPSERIAEEPLCAECLEPIDFKRTEDDCLRWCEGCQLLEGDVVYAEDSE